MAMREHAVGIRMDDSTWRLLNSYTEHVYRLVLARNGRMNHNQNRRVAKVVNAILIKFLTDNAERIRHAEHARTIRHAVRNINDPAVRAQASAAARATLAAFSVRADEGTAADQADRAVP
jgi:Flp pilus assembly protein CpaB